MFVAVSLLSVPIPGVNEPHYLTKARSYVDTDWCANDFFLQSADAHAVFFAVVGPVTQLLTFAETILAGRVLSLMLLAWGWNMLGQQLQLARYQIVAAACAFCLIAASGNFSGEWVIGGFESKVPAYGCALAAVAFWLRAWCDESRRDYAIAGIMAGMAVSWHPVVGLWFCIGIAVTELLLVVLLRLRPASMSLSQNVTAPLLAQLRKLTANGVTFALVSFVFALPGLVPALQVVMTTDVSAEQRDQANYIQVFWRLAHHLDPSTFPARAWIHTGIVAMVFVLGFGCLAWRRRQPVAARSAWWPFIGLLAAAAATAAAGVAIGWHEGPAINAEHWQMRAFLLKFYPFRFFDALLPMATALVLAKALGAFIPRRTELILAGAFVLVTVAFAWRGQAVAPSGYSARTYVEWREACEWLKHNTPADSLIYSPRESFGMKLFAERAEYVCFKDCPQDSAGILEWNQRLWRIHHWSEASYQDKLYQDSDLVDLHDQTEVNYILTKRLGPFASEPVWKNSVWRIYPTLPNSTVVK